jgi:hypothetical protein
MPYFGFLAPALRAASMKRFDCCGSSDLGAGFRPIARRYSHHSGIKLSFTACHYVLHSAFKWAWQLVDQGNQDMRIEQQAHCSLDRP